MLREVSILLMLATLLVCPLRCGWATSRCVSAGEPHGEVAACDSSTCCDGTTNRTLDAEAASSHEHGSNDGPQKHAPDCCHCLACICQGAVPPAVVEFSTNPLLLEWLRPVSFDFLTAPLRHDLWLSHVAFRPGGVDACIRYQSWLI